MTPIELALRIDHTLLRPEATEADVARLCGEALQYGFFAVCVNPVHIAYAVRILEGQRSRATSKVLPRVVGVVGFPFGACLSATKGDEARRAIDDGATEIDMVANLGALVEGNRVLVRRDIEAVAGIVHQRVRGGILKVILETAVLTEPHMILGCRTCAEGEADFVKTSTGFHQRGGATVEHVRLLYKHATPILVKASGGIRTFTQAMQMIEAGAARIGTSSGVFMIREMLDPRLDVSDEVWQVK